MQTITRPELTAALAARQLLLERRRLSPAEAIRVLTPLQGQESPAPYLALVARLEGFTQAALEAALGTGAVVKATLMRQTLHLAAGDEFPAYAQFARLTRMRLWGQRYPDLDEARVTAQLRAWLRTPRTTSEIRERVARYPGVRLEAGGPVLFVRDLVPLVHLPPAGYWRDRTRARYVLDPRRLPRPVDAGLVVIRRYLGAYGPASRADIAAWAKVAQQDFSAALERLETVSYRDERGVELLDLPGAPLPPPSTPLPVRFLGHFDQPLLAYADRERIIPPEVQPLQLPVAGATTVTVGGRVAATWELERDGGAVEVRIVPHVELARARRAEIRHEAARTARFCEPDARTYAVAGV